ncbi:hypothetical protein [Pleomorphomonas koreensis]|uniref:hypothetical protein n=1 Tax=Pleomorphomonas koreensis TaxID=257440 RepID=UPI00040F0CE6|nr:hypothetical protein [Pleomorphomonas koreensis]
MPSQDRLKKAAIIAETRRRETAEIVRLFESGQNRMQISRQLDLAPSTVSDRLAQAGFAKGKPGVPWTDAENAVLAEAAEDTTIFGKAIVDRLPGRSEAVINEKLRAMRLAAGLVTARRHTPPKPIIPTDAEEDDSANWPLPPGAMRGLHGITLPRVSILMEAHHG